MPRPSYDLFTTQDVTGGARHVLSYVAASSTNTYRSNKNPVSDNDSVGFTLETTGTLTGTFTLWWSDEPHPVESTDTDWEQDTAWTPTNPAGAATYTKYSISDIKGKWFRIRYVNASGTGNLLGWNVV